MELIYLNHKRRRRLWPVAGLLAAVGMTVTLQVALATVESAQQTIRERKRSEPAAARSLARAPATSAATIFVAGIDNGD